MSPPSNSKLCRTFTRLVVVHYIFIPKRHHFNSILLTLHRLIFILLVPVVVSASYTAVTLFFRAERFYSLEGIIFMFFNAFTKLFFFLSLPAMVSASLFSFLNSSTKVFSMIQYWLMVKITIMINVTNISLVSLSDTLSNGLAASMLAQFLHIFQMFRSTSVLISKYLSIHFLFLNIYIAHKTWTHEASILTALCGAR